MALIDYGTSFSINQTESMKDPIYGNESYIQSEETGFELAKKRHEESKKKLETKKDLENKKESKSDDKEKEEKSLNKKNDKKYNIGKKPENKHFINNKAVEEYNRRHPEDRIHIKEEESSESALTKAVIGTAAKSVGKSMGLTVCLSVGAALTDVALKGISNARARRRMGNVVEPYIEQCITDMIQFGEALKMIKDSDLIHEFKVIDPEGHYTLNAGLDVGIKKYSEEAIKAMDQKKLADHFKNMFVRIYKSYDSGNGFNTDNVALDYSETIFNGKASSQETAQKVLALIETECKKCGTTFSSRSNYFNADHSFTTALVMNPTIDVKKMCTDIEKHLKKIDVEE